MAVWLQVYGKKELPQETEGKLELCKKIFSEFDLDLSFLSGEFDVDDKFEYRKNLWMMKSELNRLNIPLLICEYPLAEFNSLKVILFDTTIVFLGPFVHFQYVSALLENQDLREGYQTVIQTIFKALGVKEVIYCTESLFLNDEFDLTFSDLEQQLQKYKENQVSRLEDMNENSFVVEKY